MTVASLVCVACSVESRRLTWAAATGDVHGCTTRAADSGNDGGGSPAPGCITDSHGTRGACASPHRGFGRAPRRCSKRVSGPVARVCVLRAPVPRTRRRSHARRGALPGKTVRVAVPGARVPASFNVRHASDEHGHGRHPHRLRRAARATGHARRGRDTFPFPLPVASALPRASFVGTDNARHPRPPASPAPRRGRRGPLLVRRARVRGQRLPRPHLHRVFRDSSLPSVLRVGGAAPCAAGGERGFAGTGRQEEKKNTAAVAAWNDRARRPSHSRTAPWRRRQERRRQRRRRAQRHPALSGAARSLRAQRDTA